MSVHTVEYLSAPFEQKGKWHLGTKDEFMPMAHGFDSYYGIPYSVDMGQSAWYGDTIGVRFTSFSIK